jgi:hypothetical protein
MRMPSSACRWKIHKDVGLIVGRQYLGVAGIHTILRRPAKSVAQLHGMFIETVRSILFSIASSNDEDILNACFDGTEGCSRHPQRRSGGFGKKRDKFCSSGKRTPFGTAKVYL